MLFCHVISKILFKHPFCSIDEYYGEIRSFLGFSVYISNTTNKELCVLETPSTQYAKYPNLSTSPVLTTGDMSSTTTTGLILRIVMGIPVLSLLICVKWRFTVRSMQILFLCYWAHVTYRKWIGLEYRNETTYRIISIAYLCCVYLILESTAHRLSETHLKKVILWKFEWQLYIFTNISFEISINHERVP